MVKNKTQSTWKKAKKIIPGGNMLLSKRPEIFLPNKWPAYFKEAKGCFVTDLDNKTYLDMSLMGVGTCVLGFANNQVDKAVINNIKKGNMSTLNCEEEYLLSKKLLSINKWADMVKFARTGGEANAIAVRIARAACNPKKQNIAICGYHGWHDWYLSANIKNKKNLDQHLLSGLSTKGVPNNLKGTIHPFNFNNIDELTKVIEKENIGIVKMEVYRSNPPSKEFLKAIKFLKNKHKFILIFDECTSGFRETYGGIHKKFNIFPDICVYGKALGNGYGITAVVGRKSIMDYAQTTFISSTFWTERVGPTAALKTLEIMQRTKSWETISKKGKFFKQRLIQLGEKYELPLNVFGSDGIPSFNFDSKNNLKYKTFITQEMLKSNILASNVIYICVKHDLKKFNDYFEHLDKIFQKIAECEKGYKIDKFLEGPVCHTTFQRLN
jgi:glutamate-1-semialdehyde 2,1-aminomutase